MLGITGDAMARPLADTLEEMQDELDLSSLFSISSSAAIFSQSIKDQLMELLPNIVVVDSIGATETGMNGIKIAQKGEKSARRSGDGAAVARLDRRRRRPQPHRARLGQIGRVARTGNIPLGYYKDPERSAQIFFEVDGTRYSIPGDFATVEADGQVTLLGRGSIVINTGGEKVFPEEVEGVLKSHPDVFDVLVVGVPDERWGERVTAVVQAREGRTPSVEELDAHCRTQIAAYKAPKQVFLVDEISRAPSGKPDYPWAKEYAKSAQPAQVGPSGPGRWTPTSSRLRVSTTPTAPDAADRLALLRHLERPGVSLEQMVDVARGTARSTRRSPTMRIRPGSADVRGRGRGRGRDLASTCCSASRWPQASASRTTTYRESDLETFRLFAGGADLFGERARSCSSRARSGRRWPASPTRRSRCSSSNVEGPLLQRGCGLDAAR